MTAKRDLKRRARERQAETGESYVTALRNVLIHARAQPPEPNPDAISVVELIDVTELGAPLGYKCRISVTPEVVDKIDVAATLTRFRDTLLATVRDRDLDLMRDITLRGLRPELKGPRGSFDELRRFLDRARAGLGGVSDSGRFVVMSVEGRSGALMLLFQLSLPMRFLHVQREAMLHLADLPPASRGFDRFVIPW